MKLETKSYIITLNKRQNLQLHQRGEFIPQTLQMCEAGARGSWIVLPAARGRLLGIETTESSSRWSWMELERQGARITQHKAPGTVSCRASLLRRVTKSLRSPLLVAQVTQLASRPFLRAPMFPLISVFNEFQISIGFSGGKYTHPLPDGIYNVPPCIYPADSGSWGCLSKGRHIAVVPRCFGATRTQPR